MIVDMLCADSNFDREDHLFRQKGFQKRDFELAYLDIRQKEGRLLSDDEVKQLPSVKKDHPLYHEWQIRAQSAERLFHHLSKYRARRILEVGCGNGWLARYLAQLPDSEVIGMDVNEAELKQGASVFYGSRNLSFVLGDVFTLELKFQFDTVVFASSLQYFEDIHKVIKAASGLLHAGGAIHILDTPFYDAADREPAQARSSEYFSRNNSAMRNHYFHHAKPDLVTYDPTYLYDPSSPLRKLKNKFFNDSPFPWIKINKFRND